MFITRFLGGEDLVAHECQDVLTVAIGQPEHLVHVLAAIASVMIKQYMGPTPRTPRIFVHGFQRPELADAKNQGPTGGVDHSMLGTSVQRRMTWYKFYQEWVEWNCIQI